MTSGIPNRGSACPGPGAGGGVTLCGLMTVQVQVVQSIAAQAMNPQAAIVHQHVGLAVHDPCQAPVDDQGGVGGDDRSDAGHGHRDAGGIFWGNAQHLQHLFGKRQVFVFVGLERSIAQQMDREADEGPFLIGWLRHVEVRGYGFASGLTCLGPSPVRSQRRCTQNSSAISSSRAKGTPRLNQLLTCWGVTPRRMAKSEGVRWHSRRRTLRRSPEVFMEAESSESVRGGNEPGVDEFCRK